MAISPEILQAMRDGTPAERRYICSQEFLYFVLYYFSEYCTYQFAPFHFEMCGDLDDIRDGDIEKLMWVIFRESAKTTFAKIFEIWGW